jgi:hypothetical protein
VKYLRYMRKYFRYVVKYFRYLRKYLRHVELFEIHEKVFETYGNILSLKKASKIDFNSYLLLRIWQILAINLPKGQLLPTTFYVVFLSSSTKMFVK